MSAPDNPPAFPSVCLNDPGHPHSIPGMTLRDHFAGQALAGLLANSQIKRTARSDDVAQSAYDFADAMLAARQVASAASEPAVEEVPFVAWQHATCAPGDIIEVRERDGTRTVMRVGSPQFMAALRQLGTNMGVRAATAEQRKGWEGGK